MSFWEKLKTFVTRCGPPSKFVAKALIGIAVPGSYLVMELIDRVFDSSKEPTQAALEKLASKQDLQCVEKMLDVMLGDLKGVVEHLRHLEQVPHIAQETLTTALSLKPECMAAVKMLREQSFQLTGMQTELEKLATGQEDLREVYQRLYGAHLDYIEEQRLHNVSPADLDARLRRIEEGILAVRGGAPDRAQAIFSDMSTQQPDSVVLVVAEAAAQAAGCNFTPAAKALERAARMRPGDLPLVQMSQVATRYSAIVTPAPAAPVTTKHPRPGEMLDGWRLEKLLGRGGWGQVFLARKQEHLRAIKIMHAELAQDADLVNRFQREMSMLVVLGEHPNLVSIDPKYLFRWTVDWNCWYYVMEYIEGVSLERYLETQGSLSLGQARSLFTGIAEGLAGAHGRGLIHRDIKPANILIRTRPTGNQGMGVLVDFGLAGRVDPHSRGGGYTALFAAPEQMRHGVSDCRSDVYSLAATIYYCLLYHDADKRGRFKAKHLPADIPADVRALLDRCLDNDPDERPGDTGAFVREWRNPTQVEPAHPSLAEVHRRQKEERDRILAEAQRLEKLGKYAEAVAKVQELPAEQRDPGYIQSLCIRRDEAARLDREIAAATQRGQLSAQHQPTLLRLKELQPFRAAELDGLLAAIGGLGLPSGYTNGLGMKFVLVTAGKFWMGGGGGALGVQQAQIAQDYYIGSHLVTQEDWQTIMGGNPSYFSRNGRGKEYVRSISDADLKRFPVEQVSWDEVQLFAQRLNAREKPGVWVYRLPTEAEWEYACRAGASSVYDCAFHYYLDRPTNSLSPGQANFSSKLQRTSKVGSYPANRLGIHDMHGNVWEWCQDAQGAMRVVRGGCWDYDGEACQASFRGCFAPATRSSGVGLRLTLVPSGC
jgi:formylglycine-generating enzyme required for sulfatase activity/serine/threonine protein kinase